MLLWWWMWLLFVYCCFFSALIVNFLFTVISVLWYSLHTILRVYNHNQGSKAAISVHHSAESGLWKRMCELLILWVRWILPLPGSIGGRAFNCFKVKAGICFLTCPTDQCCFNCMVGMVIREARHSDRYCVMSKENSQICWEEFCASKLKQRMPLLRCLTLAASKRENPCNALTCATKANMFLTCSPFITASKVHTAKPVFTIIKQAIRFMVQRPATAGQKMKEREQGCRVLQCRFLSSSGWC